MPTCTGIQSKDRQDCHESTRTPYRRLQPVAELLFPEHAHAILDISPAPTLQEIGRQSQRRGIDRGRAVGVRRLHSGQQLRRDLAASGAEEFQPVAGLMDAGTRRAVRFRAEYRCEYCGLHQDDSPFSVLHVKYDVPRKRRRRESGACVFAMQSPQKAESERTRSGYGRCHSSVRSATNGMGRSFPD